MTLVTLKGGWPNCGLMCQFVVLDQALQAVKVRLVEVQVLFHLDVRFSRAKVLVGVVEVYGKVRRQWGHLELVLLHLDNRHGHAHGKTRRAWKSGKSWSLARWGAGSGLGDQPLEGRDSCRGGEAYIGRHRGGLGSSPCGSQLKVIGVNFSQPTICAPQHSAAVPLGVLHKHIDEAMLVSSFSVLGHFCASHFFLKVDFINLAAGWAQFCCFPSLSSVPGRRTIKKSKFYVI